MIEKSSQLTEENLSQLQSLNQSYLKMIEDGDLATAQIILQQIANIGGGD